jgi:hypothetical protein
MGIHRRHSITRRSRGDRRCGSAFGQLGVGLLFAIAIVSSGCRSGTSTFSSPSWWAFGNSAGSDPEKLAAAPPFDGKTADGKITKPSQTATPYPTTTTPNSYSVADATRGLPNDPAAVATAPVEQAAVTYGSTPPPAAVAQTPAAAGATISSMTSPMTAPSTMPSTTPMAAAPPPGGPQVGPYASLPGQIPTAGNAQPLVPPPLADAPASGFPATAGYEPAARMADASTPAAADPTATSRYSSSTSSRFGGGLEPPPSAPPAASALLPAAPLTPPPAASSIPQSVPPPTQGAVPSPPPARRPDPGYRPGGTSSYRPARSILADEQPTPPSAVRTAAYEVPATSQR